MPQKVLRARPATERNPKPHSTLPPAEPPAPRAAFLTPDGGVFEVADVSQEEIGQATAHASEASLRRLWEANEEDAACRIFPEAT